MLKGKELFGGIVTAVALCVVWACGDETATTELTQPTDTEITAAVQTEYLLHPNVDHADINVATVDGVVTLSGTVEDLLAGQRAVEIVEATRGVRSVVDRIDVQPPERSDEAIRSDVVQSLLDDPATESYEIETSVEDGVVTLSGSVDSWAERELAYDVVSGVRGVRAINNVVTIEYEDRVDHEVASDVERRLETDVLVDAGLIEVAVSDSKVELSGVVGSLQELHRAVRDAHVNGALEVVADSLEIRWWARDEMRRNDPIVDLSDDEIEAAVTDALIYDPRVLSTTIDVSSSGGMVTLDGTVSSLREHRAAIEDAANTYGVWDVVDSLLMEPDAAMSDLEIEEMVRNALLRDPYVDELEIVVDVLDGTAYLGGVVNGVFEKVHAEWIVSNLRNVKAVENSIDILPSPPAIDDEQIAEKFRQKILWSPWLADADIAVTVANGVVTVNGAVEDRFEMHLLEDIADEIVGVRALEMDLMVEKWPSPPDLGVDLTR